MRILKVIFYLRYLVLFPFFITSCSKATKEPTQQQKQFITVQDQLKAAQDANRYDEYEKSLKILDAIDYEGETYEESFVPLVYGTYARNYVGLSMFEESIKYWERSIRYIEKTNLANNRLHAVFYNNIASSYLVMGKVDKAHANIQKAISIYPIPGSYMMLSKITLETEGNKEKSDIYLQKAMKSVRGEGFKYFYALGTAYRGFAYQREFFCDYNAALEYYHKAAICIEKSSAMDFILLEVYEKIHSLALKVNDKSLSQKYERRITDLKIEINKRKSETLKTILKDNIAKKETLKIQNSQWVSISITGGLLGLGLVFFLLAFSKARKVKLEKLDSVHSSMKELNESYESRINIAFNEVVDLAKKNDPTFIVRFQEVYPEVYKKMTDLSSNLTVADHIFIAMIWLNFSSKEIANYTFVQHKSVQIKKYRLRKKLGISKDVDLFKWVRKL